MAHKNKTADTKLDEIFDAVSQNPLMRNLRLGNPPGMQGQAVKRPMSEARYLETARKCKDLYGKMIRSLT